MKKISNPEKFRANVKTIFTDIFDNKKYGDNLEKDI